MPKARRDDLVKFLAVAEAGKLLAAAETLGIAQPALTRAIARLEKRFGGKLFERLPTGVRPTPLGAAAVNLAQGVLREIEAAEEKMEAAVSGRIGRFRITATAMWMQAVLAPACEAFRRKLPGVELVLHTAPFAEGLRLLARGESDLHCGGFDAGDPLPAFLRRDSFLEVTAGIVAGEGHPLLDGNPAPDDLAAFPWIDFDRPLATGVLGPMQRTIVPEGVEVVIGRVQVHVGERQIAVVVAFERPRAGLEVRPHPLRQATPVMVHAGNTASVEEDGDRGGAAARKADPEKPGPPVRAGFRRRRIRSDRVLESRCIPAVFAAHAHRCAAGETPSGPCAAPRCRRRTALRRTLRTHNRQSLMSSQGLIREMYSMS